MNQSLEVGGDSAITNRFELRLMQERTPDVTDARGFNPAELWLYAEIWIDGKLLDEPHRVCVISVLRSLEKPRSRQYASQWEEVFTCGCGTAACANIDEGVGVVHTEDNVDWVFRRPQANKFGSDPIGYRTWCETAKWHQYHFDRHQATRELIRFLDEVWLVLKTSDLKPSNHSDILNWFDHDPRSPMRDRGITWTESDEL